MSAFAIMQRNLSTNGLPGRGKIAPGASGHLKTYMAQGGRCFHCGKPMHTKHHLKGGGNNGWSREHLIPRACGGYGIGCIVLAHWHCNNKRGAKRPTSVELTKAAAVFRRAHGVIPSAIINYMAVRSA
jgi:5-methylcytosine-specific restriction endonuclease McrA